MRQLDEVVGEADRCAGDGGEEDGQRRGGVAAEREEGEPRGEDDQGAAHRGRSLLHDVPGGSLLADVLPEPATAQERDELGADEDRDQHRDDGGDEHSRHQTAPAFRACATNSSPAARDAFTRTASPGRRRAQRRGRASSRVVIVAPPYSRARSPPTATTWSTPSSRATCPTSRWKRGASGPSSAISPRIAIVRRPFARSTRCSSAARIETGFAL